MPREVGGMGMVVASATAYGTTPILAKLAYASGLGTEQILSLRFALAAVGLIAVAAALGQSPFGIGVERLAKLLGVGAFVYTAQSLTFFLALRSLPASLAELMSFTYPTLVVLFGVLCRAQRIRPLHGLALVGSLGGVALLLGSGTFHITWDLVFAIANPIACAAYILIGERVMDRSLALQTSSVIISGAAIGFVFLAAARGQALAPVNPEGWAVILALVVLPTMLGVSLVLAALPRIGAVRTAVLGTLEPVITVALAAAILGDRLSAWQLIGAAILIGSAITLQFGHATRTEVVQRQQA